MKFLSSIIFFLICTATTLQGYEQGCCYGQGCCGCWYGELNFLYWQADMGNLQLALRAPTVIYPSNDPNINKRVETHGKLFDPGSDGQWSPGVRAALGWCSPCCPVQSEISGTYFHSKTNVSQSAPPLSSGLIDYIIPLLNPASMGSGAQSFDGFWEVDFVTLDWLAAWRFALCRSTSLSPFFGIQAACIRQKLQANFHNPFFAIPNSAPLSAPLSQSIGITDYWGVGLKGGVDFDVPLFCRICCVGGVGGSLLYGRANIKSRLHGFHAEEDLSNFFLESLDADFTARKMKVCANLEANIGLAYRLCRTMSISASYFLSVWFDQNQFLNYYNSAPTFNLPNINTNAIIEGRHGNLQLSGLILSFDYLF